MIDSSDIHEPLGDIEAMVRSAANYVQVSKDLRPRVMDAARLSNGEQRSRRYVYRAALVAALLTWCVTTSVNRLDMRDDLRELSLATASSSSISNSRGAGDGAWVLVNAFTELRGRQADVLRLKL